MSLCAFCRRMRRHVQHVPLPLTGDIVAVCLRCYGPRFLAHMRGLIAHG